MEHRLVIRAQTIHASTMGPRKTSLCVFWDRAKFNRLIRALPALTFTQKKFKLTYSAVDFCCSCSGL